MSFETGPDNNKDTFSTRLRRGSKRARMSQDEEGSLSPVDVDAIVDQVLRENIEDFEIKSSPSRHSDLSNVEEIIQDDDRQAGEESEYKNETKIIISHSDLDNNVVGQFEKDFTDSEVNSMSSMLDYSDGGLVIEKDGSEFWESSQLNTKEGVQSEISDSETDMSFVEEIVVYTDMASDFSNESEGEFVGLKCNGEVASKNVIEQVHRWGPNQFIEHCIEAQRSPDSILEALGFPLPDGLVRADDEGKWNYVRRFLLKCVYERPRLGISTLDEAVELIRNARKITVLTGAGISVSCGIPDFRSEGGLYSRIREEFSLPEPECMFDIEFFRIDPEPFYSFAREIMPNEQIRPSFSHTFIAELERRNQLLNNYTQNIDTLEIAAGIKNVVHCHGSFSTATCLDCGAKFTFTELKEMMEKDLVPECDLCQGVIKPDIVFFGESLPKYFDECISKDSNETDLLLVIGSSLKVHPVSSIPDFIPPNVPQILINRESLDHNFDLELLGNCDEILGELFRRLGWSLSEESLALRFNTVINRPPVESTFVDPIYHLFPGAKFSHQNNNDSEESIDDSNDAADELSSDADISNP